MGLFGNFFSGSESKINWNPIKSEEDLKELDQASHEKVQVLFKHSTRCSISSMALNRVERAFDYEEEAVDMNFLDLIQFRSVSNMVADKYGVRHESPQMIVIRNSEVLHHSSHNMIDINVLKEYI